MIKLGKSNAIKLSIFVILPVVLTLLIFFLYRKYFYDSKFINKTLLKIDMEFKYFVYDEFDSRIGKGEDEKTYYRNGFDYITDSGKNHMNKDTIKKLDKARDIIELGWNKLYPSKKIYFKINSGYRTDVRNSEVGGVTNSAHRDKGNGAHAVDISWKNYNKEQRQEILNVLREVGFSRIGKANTFVHVDNDSTLPQVGWLYNGYNNLV